MVSLRCSTHYPSTTGTLINSASESSVPEAELTGLCNNNNELQEEKKHFRNLECKWAVSRKKDFTYTLLVYLYLYTKHLLNRFFLNTHKNTHTNLREIYWIILLSLFLLIPLKIIITWWEQAVSVQQNRI